MPNTTPTMLTTMSTTKPMDDTEAVLSFPFQLYYPSIGRTTLYTTEGYSVSHYIRTSHAQMSVVTFPPDWQYADTPVMMQRKIPSPHAPAQVRPVKKHPSSTRNQVLCKLQASGALARSNRSRSSCHKKTSRRRR